MLDIFNLNNPIAIRLDDCVALFVTVYQGSQQNWTNSVKQGGGGCIIQGWQFMEFGACGTNHGCGIFLIAGKLCNFSPASLFYWSFFRHQYSLKQITFDHATGKKIEGRLFTLSVFILTGNSWVKGILRVSFRGFSLINKHMICIVYHFSWKKTWAYKKYLKWAFPKLIPMLHICMNIFISTTILQITTLISTKLQHMCSNEVDSFAGILVVSSLLSLNF